MIPRVTFALLVAALPIAPGCTAGGDDADDPFVVPRAPLAWENKNASASTVPPDNMGPPPDVSRPSTSFMLGCRTGAPPPWLQGPTSFPDISLCTGSIQWSLGGVLIESAVRGAPASAVIDSAAPFAALPLECGYGCGLADERVLVLTGADNKRAVLIDGHDQVRFERDEVSWRAQPYFYSHLAAYKVEGGRLRELVGDFKDATTWFLRHANGSWARFDKFGDAWRVGESNDELAAHDKGAFARAQPGAPAPSFLRGKTELYEREAGTGKLLAIRDFKSLRGIVSKVFTYYTAAEDAQHAGLLKSIATDVKDGVAVSTMTYHYVDRELRSVDVGSGAHTALAYDAEHRVERYVTAVGEVFTYQWGPGRRLARVEHVDRDRAWAFYYEKGTGAAHDCTGNVAAVEGSELPCRVRVRDETMKQEARTNFTPFAHLLATNDTDARYARTTANTPGVGEVTHQRNAAGYLNKTADSGARVVVSWTPDVGDAIPAGRWVVKRSDPPAGPGFDPDVDTNPRGTDAVVFEARYFDEEQLLRRVVDQGGDRSIDYQRDRRDRAICGMPAIPAADFDATLGWARHMTACTVTRRLAVQTGPVAPPLNRRTTRMQVTPLVPPAPGAPALPAGAAFQIEEDASFQGGPVRVLVDERLRTIARQVPGELPGAWSETTYDDYGRVSGTVEPAAGLREMATFHPSGAVKTYRKTYCGTTIADLSTDVNAQGFIVRKRDNAGGVLTETELGNFLPDGTPGLFTTRHTAGGVLRYTQTREVTFAPNSSVVVGADLTNAVPKDALFPAVTETSRRRWTQHGYAPPPAP